jgi:sugar lactone lactonase YvrE
MDDGYCITNGPATSPDGRTLYHTDTLKKLIYAFDVSAAGELSNRRVFAAIEDGAGHPDGTAVDADGCVWIALFGGWGVRRYSPGGQLLETVALPVANVTKIAFGGDDLRTAYATTARKGLSAAELAAQPRAGDLFAFRVDTPGLPQHHVAHA